MTVEEQVIQILRRLPDRQQQAVLNFAEFLQARESPTQTTTSTTQTAPQQSGLKQFIGAAPGSFDSPEAVDQFIRNERDTWAS